MRAVTADCYCLTKWGVYLEDFWCPQKLKTGFFSLVHRY